MEKELEREKLRHSTSHVLAQAVKRLFPQAKLGIGPPIREGFYYDFEIDGKLISDNLSRIEEEMKKIVKENLPIKRKEISRAQAVKVLKEEPYKLELLRGIKEKKVTLYQQGEFVDLCQGPHLESTGEIKYFKLLSVAGAYWRGKEENPMLTRIYGTVFFQKQDLEDYLKKLEEAEKRDHRRLGRELELFTTSPELGPGFVLYYPKGAILRELIERFEKDEHLKRGYLLVSTPHLSRAELWKTSGHFDFYRKNMYYFSLGEEEYVVKPMNCPAHILIYKSKIRSYRDLPLRYFELGTVYRREESGVLHGLLRARGFTQDDAHIFCTPSQVKEEVKEVIKFALYMMETFGLGYSFTLSTRPEKFIGEEGVWERATSSLREALEEENLPFVLAEGEGAFYGPKIDIQMEDALGRKWQGPTIQVDFNLPERFDLFFIDSGGERKRPVVIHRVVLGAIERFLGVLTEHYGGGFPLWLSPVQVKVLTVTEKEKGYAREVTQKLKEEGIRVELDERNELLGYKVREAQVQKIPYMVIIGKKEKEEKTITVRKRSGENLKGIALKDFISLVKEKVRTRSRET